MSFVEASVFYFDHRYVYSTHLKKKGVEMATKYIIFFQRCIRWFCRVVVSQENHSKTVPPNHASSFNDDCDPDVEYLLRINFAGRKFMTGEEDEEDEEKGGEETDGINSSSSSSSSCGIC
jgi:hypothetical protein